MTETKIPEAIAQDVLLAILAKNAECSKLRTAYDRAKDASLQAKKAMDGALQDLQSLIDQISDPQGRFEFADATKVIDDKTPALTALAEAKAATAEAEPQEPQADGNDGEPAADAADEPDQADEPADTVAFTPSAAWPNYRGEQRDEVLGLNNKQSDAVSDAGLHTLGDVWTAMQSEEGAKSKFQKIRGMGGKAGVEIIERARLFVAEQSPAPEDKPKSSGNRIRLTKAIEGFTDTVEGAEFEVQQLIGSTGYLVNDENGNPIIVPKGSAEAV